MNQLLWIAVLLPLIFAFVGRNISEGKNGKAGLRDACFVLATVLEGCIAGVIFTGQKSGILSVSLPEIVGLGLSFRADAFRSIYGCVTAFLWLMAMLFALEYLKHDKDRKRYCFYNLITLSGVIGVFFSADLFTTFVFFELMSFASYPLMIHEETEGAMKAGETYLGVAVISGMMLLAGVFFLQKEAGTLVFEELRTYFATAELTGLGFAGGILVLLGFGAKAGMYPLHIWLPQAHPVAPSPASALLSGILTKTGVFGIIVLSADVFAGNALFGSILLTLAVITMFLGALLALFSVNLKRTLACSSMSQIGFILVGVSFTVLLGREGGLAQNGALLHMVNHSLIKLVLFLCAGVVAMNIHALDLNEIRGYGRKKPFLAVIFLIGALGIMGIPLFNGYVSKTMIHESIVEYMELEKAVLPASTTGIFKAVEWIFLTSGGLTVAYMTKLFICIFVEQNADRTRQETFDRQSSYLSPLSCGVLAVSALPLLFIGLFPNLTVEKITSPAFGFFGVDRLEETLDFFSWECLKGGLISIGIGVAIYFLLVRTVFLKESIYRNLWNPKLDLERGLYRPVLVNGTVGFVKYVVAPIAGFFEFLMTDGVLFFILNVVRFFVLLFDRIILLLNKTVLKSHVYRYREESFAMRMGKVMDKFFSKNKKHRFAERMDSFSETVGRVVAEEYTSFSFAYAMISLGVIIILLFAVFG